MGEKYFTIDWDQWGKDFVEEWDRNFKDDPEKLVVLRVLFANVLQKAFELGKSVKDL